MSQKTCLINTCLNIINKGGLGYCGKHYQRYKKHGDPLKLTKISPKEHDGKCIFSGCSKPFFGRNLCSYHYNNLPDVKLRVRKWARRPEPRHRQLIHFNNKYYPNSTVLDLELFKSLIPKPCFYCNQKLNETGHGLDRIDNSKGYEPNNVLPCCCSCNKTRGDRFTVEETQTMISALMDFRTKKVE